MESHKRIHVSIIVIGHDEGRLIYRTLRSMKRCQIYATRQGISSELILVLDSVDNATRSVVQQWRETFKIDQLTYTNYSDPGPARNFGATLARGEYLMFIDGDDLYSDNLVHAAYITARLEGPKTIVQAEYNVCFGRTSFFLRHINQQSPEYDSRELLFTSFWSPPVLISQEVFRSLWFKEIDPKKGLGPEDWLLICEAISLNCTICVAKDTVRFYRLKEKSRSLSHTQERTVVPANDFFEDKRIFSYNYSPALPPQNASKNPWLIESAQALALFIHHHLFLPLFYRSGESKKERMTILANRVKRWLGIREVEGEILPTISTESTTLPEWVIDEMKKIADIEPDLFPTSNLITSFVEYRLPRKSEELKNLYGWLLRQWPVEEKYTHVFLLPAVSTGGASKVAFSFIKALHYDFNQRPIIITTEKQQSDWLNKLPPEVRVIELGQKSASVSDEEGIEKILLRLLIQRQPAVIHVIGSEMGWRLLAGYGLALNHYSRLYGMNFLDWFNDQNQPLGFFRGYLDKSYPNLSGVLTDNQTYRRLYIKLLGLSPDLIQAIYSAVDPQLRNYRRFLTDEILQSKQILWAGRLDYHKRPDILAAIAEKLKDHTFWVYGRSVLDHNLSFVERLKQLPNVRLMGSYESFKELLERPYGLLLYTSQMDGIPIILLEATMAGLPVVAPDVGGVKEVINQETGFLVSDYQDVEEYCRVIRLAEANTEETRKRLAKAINLVEERHSWEKFIQAIKGIPGYLAINKK